MILVQSIHSPYSLNYRNKEEAAIAISDDSSETDMPLVFAK